MNIYRRLVELAVNLDEAETEATISRTASKCGFESWNELMNHCDNKRIP
jgi:DNA-binding MurR/RpiR family transcriptional regulator